MLPTPGTLSRAPLTVVMQPSQMSLPSSSVTFALVATGAAGAAPASLLQATRKRAAAPVTINRFMVFSGNETAAGNPRRPDILRSPRPQQTPDQRFWTDA